MSHNFGLNSKSKMTTSKIHGANFLQKRLNQLPNLFSSNVERDDDQMSCSSSGTAKKEKFRIRNFLSASTQAHDMDEERVKRRLHHQNLSLNSATKPSSPVRTVAIQTSKHYKSTLKECLSQKNVRRKSSTLNTSCVNFANPCNRATQLSFKSSHLHLGLIQKAARRGSIHFYDNKKKKDQEGDTFRQKLLQLQRLQLEFLESNTQFAYHGANRRKLAFAIMEECDDYVRCHEPAIPRLSHAISSLSLIVNDEESSGGDKLVNQNRVSLTNSLTDVNEELINEKNNEIGRVTKWATGFERLLEDPLGLQIFTEFLKKEFSEENIDFWVKCENFKKLSDVEEMKAEASNIWQTYLDTSSMCQINVDNKARSSCQDALLTPYNTMFELAQTQIFTLMKYDSYSRFLKSLMYKDCIVNEMEGKPILSALNGNKSKKPETIISVNSPSNNDNSEIVDDNQTNQSIIPNASSNLATAVAVVASTGAALITNVTVSNSTQVNDPLSSTNLTITSNSNSLPNDPNRKEKKRSTIIPWTKAFIKWKRLSGEPPNTQGKEKKSQASNLESQTPGSIQNQNPTLTSGVAATLGKGISLKYPLSGIPETTNGISQITLDQVTPPTVLNSQIESKFCRVLCSNDGSSTMIQPIPGQTVYQAMNKIFSKKNIPWYKCDLYFVGDYTLIDQNMDAQVLCSKEICLVERSLFVLSLTPIAINLCVKANMKKTIFSILQPILDFYQIKANNCGIFLQNSSNCVLNVNDPCSSIDGQHILIVHKQQTTFFSQTEIDKLIKVSIDDFIPNNMNDFQLQFDELGILKQFKKNNSISPILSPTSPTQTSISTNSLSTSSLLSSGFRLVKQDIDDPVQYPNFKNQAQSASKKSKIPNVTREKSYSLNVDKGHNSLIKKLLETSCKKCSYTLTRSRSPMVIVSDNKNDI